MYSSSSAHICAKGLPRLPARRAAPLTASSRAAVAPLRTARATRAATGPRPRAGTCVASAVAYPGEEESKEEDAVAGALRVPTTGMAALGSSGGAVLERTKFEQKQEVRQSSPKIDEGGGGGNKGGGKDLGGGGGDGDDGDDDDYGEEGDGDGEGENGWWRNPLGETFDPRALQSVLSEFGRTAADLPIILRQGVELGLFSASMIFRFFSADVRPSVARAVYERLPPAQAKGIIGRLMADPGFLQKMALDTALACGINVAWEWQQRGPRAADEVDQIAISTACLAAANAALIYRLAPMRAHGSTGRPLPWQQLVNGVPNNVFEASSKAMSFTHAGRAGSLLMKTGELSLIGAIAGASTSALQQAAVALRRKYGPDANYSPSMPIPGVQAAAVGTGAFMGISSNLRYQALFGFDRLMFDRAKTLGPALLSTGVLRGVSCWAGQASRNWCLGLPHELPAKYRVRNGKVYAHVGGYKYKLFRGGPKAAARGSGRVVRRRMVRRTSSGSGPRATEPQTVA
ncbi:unnamed protein product [Pedinophyceae sp. YPF-701]|nr:unnamed protein product [Pedinophyceae sp. YPF-701]